jgi:WD40 repeat protein/serine/threonine protein kinase
MVQQTQPVQRVVALKIIKAGRDSAEVLARFELERQALAMMDHPNIAKVLDAGTVGDSGQGSGVRNDAAGSSLTPDPYPLTAVSGRPFFVMELVKGIPITKYCDQEHLTPQQRLDLFIPVCLAVQHAHQKGVIHRDLKPSNILVALYDGKPVPKVIDFGIAKATSQKLTEKTLCTEVGQIIGTLEYMPPEQAELNNLDIDTRADIYALGVVLYELLAGSTPFTGRQLRAAGAAEMFRIIREVEPSKPSTKLSSLDTLPSIAAHRKLEPKRLMKLLRGDLDWIVMKCLEKDRARRYETANGLALDIERYLRDDPVSAGPPSAGYRLRKFVRRNRGLVLAVTSVLLALTIGALVSYLMYLGAREQERIASEKTKEALRDQDIAVHRADEAIIALADRDKAIGQARTEAAAKEQALRDEEAATRRANQQADEARRLLADSRVLLAQSAWREGNVFQARQRLELIPRDLRGWEWNYLSRQFDGSAMTLHGHVNTVQTVAYSPDGGYVASAAFTGPAKLWDARTGVLLRELNRAGHNVQRLVISPDGSQVAVLTRPDRLDTPSQLCVYDAQTGKLRFEPRDLRIRAASLAFSPDGLRIATCGAGSVDIWDARTGQSSAQFEVRNNQAREPLPVSLDLVAFSPDGARLAVAAGAMVLRIWDAQGTRQLLDLSSLAQSMTTLTQVLSFSFSPDGTRLALATDHERMGYPASGELAVCDVRTGKLLTRHKDSSIGYKCVAFSPDGARLATGAGPRFKPGTVQVWDARTLERQVELTGHTGAVNSVSFSPDGCCLASGSFDATVKIWDSRPGRAAQELGTTTRSIHCVACSPDGTRLAVGGKEE